MTLYCQKKKINNCSVKSFGNFTISPMGKMIKTQNDNPNCQSTRIDVHQNNSNDSMLYMMTSYLVNDYRGFKVLSGK